MSWRPCWSCAFKFPFNPDGAGSSPEAALSAGRDPCTTSKPHGLTNWRLVNKPLLKKVFYDGQQGVVTGRKIEHILACLFEENTLVSSRGEYLSF